MKFSLLYLIILAACSNPTPYERSENEDTRGYSDDIVSGDLRKSTFQGNESTEKDKAELFAKFRTIEVCEKLGKKFSHILLVNDRTHKEEKTETAVVDHSYYYYGMSPYYGAGYRWGMSPVSYAPTTQTVSKTKTYPAFDIYFECVDKPYDARISFQNLSHSQIKDLTKDMMGAVQVKEVFSESPNLQKLQKGDIIYKVNGQRVGKMLDVYEASRKTQQRPANVEFFRGGSKFQTTVTYREVTDLVEEAQQEIIKSACKIDQIKKESEVCKK